MASLREIVYAGYSQVPACCGNRVIFKDNSYINVGCGNRAVYKDCYHNFDCCEQCFQKEWKNHGWHVKQSSWELFINEWKKLNEPKESESNQEESATIGS